MVNGTEIYVLNLLTFREAKWRKEKKKKEKIFRRGYYALFTSVTNGGGVFVTTYNKQYKE